MSIKTQKTMTKLFGAALMFACLGLAGCERWDDVESQPINVDGYTIKVRAIPIANGVDTRARWFGTEINPDALIWRDRYLRATEQVARAFCDNKKRPVASSIVPLPEPFVGLYVRYKCMR
jgi:hypothetical protein